MKFIFLLFPRVLLFIPFIVSISSSLLLYLGKYIEVIYLRNVYDMFFAVVVSFH